MIITWLPLPSFKETALLLSDEDLKMQRYHALAVLEALHQIENSKLPNSLHAADCRNAALMWSRYETQLAEYGLEICEEYGIRTRRQDDLYEEIAKHLEWSVGEDTPMGKPEWFGDPRIHESHQAALVRKDPEFYRPIFPDVETDLSLVWALT